MILDGGKALPRSYDCHLSREGTNVQEGAGHGRARQLNPVLFKLHIMESTLIATPKLKPKPPFIEKLHTSPRVDCR